jgi:hypothetical protein
VSSSSSAAASATVQYAWRWVCRSLAAQNCAGSMPDSFTLYVPIVGIGNDERGRSRPRAGTGGRMREVGWVMCSFRRVLGRFRSPNVGKRRRRLVATPYACARRRISEERSGVRGTARMVRTAARACCYHVRVFVIENSVHVWRIFAEKTTSEVVSLKLGFR